MTKGPAYLMDASAFIHRGFHAMGGLSGPLGQPTGAIFGYANSLLSLIKDKKPELLAIVFDSRGPGRRHGIYPKYKENRGPMPDDLAQQQAPIRELTEALGLYSLEKEGFEADDLIATFARRLVKADYEVVIVSGDKDFYQLLSEKVSMFDPSPKKSSAMNAESFRAKYDGLEPAAFLEMQGLMGDSSDNIPGVPKVGEVTAKKLIQKYGTVANLYKSLEEGAEVATKAIQESLKNHRDEALVSLELARLGADDVPEVDFNLLRPRSPDLAKLGQLCRELGFTRLQGEIRRIYGDGEATLSFSPPQNGLAGGGPVGLKPGSVDPAASDRQSLSQASPAGSEPLKVTASAVVDYDKYQLIGQGDFEALLEKLAQAETIALDLETDSVSAAKANVVGLSLATGPNEACYLPFKHLGARESENLNLGHCLEKLGPILKDPTKKLLAQNAKFDWLILARHDLPLPPPQGDPLLASYLLNPDDRHGLDVLSSRILNHRTIAFADLGLGKNETFGSLSLERAVRYAAEDADLAYRLAGALGKELSGHPQLLALYEKVELPLSELLMRMELAGALIDKEAISTIGQELGQGLVELEKKIYSLAGKFFNVGSPKQLSEVLFNDLNLKAGKKTAKKTGFSTDNEVLSELAHAHPIVPEILKWRETAKLKNTYADKLPLSADESGRIHTTFNQAMTATGRLSSSDPNLQNIPARSPEGQKIRSFFVAPPGSVLVGADYSQIELRIMAHFSQDKALKEAFKNDEDIHAETAARIFRKKMAEVTPAERRQAKTINFGVIYGQGPYGLSKRLGVEHSAAKILIDDYFARFPGIRDYMAQIKLNAQKAGQVETWFGRVRRLEGLNSLNVQVRREAERMAINTPIQGTAADLIKMAMLKADEALKKRGLKARLILQVH
ncbi:MAG: DNA polymerase I, partial [Deltaproteobacteria bacterium]|nr:DNA polymerase I [Deltaproteobacteria bacterium]